MVRKFRTMFPAHPGGLRIYPDASASSASAGGQSLLEIMEEGFEGYPSDPEFYVPPKNPRVPDRIHSVNQVLRGANKWLPLLIDETCEYLIEDMHRVQWNEPGTGLMKISDPDDDRALLTHATDALGYWVMMDMPSSFFIETVDDAIYREKAEARRYYGGLAGL